MNLSRHLTAPILCALLAATTMAAGPARVAPSATDPLYGATTPPVEIITWQVDGAYISFRAERREIEMWGRRVAVLAYSGPLVAGQREVNDGRYSVIVVARNPAGEVLFLREHVWPALGSGFMPTGRLKGLDRDELLHADDLRLDRLEQNLLRAAWYSRLMAAGLAAGAGQTGRGERASRVTRFQQQVIEAAERDGFIHEAQHALDEAHRVSPESYRDPLTSRVAAEMRAILAAMAHSATPHYVVYHAVRQYRRHIEPYGDAVARLLPALARQAAEGGKIPRVDLTKNFILQIPRLDEQVLRDLAATTMAALFEAGDRQAGYDLDYTSHRSPVASLRVGALRGSVRPADLPGVEPLPEGESGPLIFWQLAPEGVVSSGVHVYFSPSGVQLARRERLGLAIDSGGHVAVHLRTPPQAGPWLLAVDGGRFTTGVEATRAMPLEVVPGDGPPVRIDPQEDGTGFGALIPAAAVRNGVLRLVLRHRGGDPAAAFVTGFSLSATDG